MNRRLLAVLLLLSAILLLAFSVSFLLYNPQVTNSLATRTKSIGYTQAAEALMTETAQFRILETGVAMTKTQAAIPTNTNTPTNTITPTNTAEPTSPPQVIPCQALVSASIATLSMFPGGSDANDSVLHQGESVAVVGRVKDGGWNLVQHAGSKKWIKSNAIEFTDPNCRIVEQSLAYLVGLLDNGSSVIVDETFTGNEYFWNIDGALQSPLVTDYNDAYLQLDSRNAETKFLSSTRATLPVEDPFTLLVNFERTNISTDSFVGVRFRSNGTNFYELRILPTCVISAYKNEELLFSQTIITDENNCKDDLPDILLMQVNSSNVLSVSLNGSLPVEINLGESDFSFLEGNFDLIAFRSTIKFYYLVITTP